MNVSSGRDLIMLRGTSRILNIIAANGFSPVIRFIWRQEVALRTSLASNPSVDVLRIIVGLQCASFREIVKLV